MNIIKVEKAISATTVEKDHKVKFNSGLNNNKSIIEYTCICILVDTEYKTKVSNYIYLVSPLASSHITTPSWYLNHKYIFVAPKFGSVGTIVFV